MKVSIRRWLSLAILPAAFAAVLASSPAQAADYTGDCASVPSSVSGNISITESGACNISHSISATGYISVVSTGGSITAKDMSAAYHINIKTSSGSIDVENLTANTADSVGNIRIEATGNVKTKTISTAGSSGTGGVEIHANTDGTSSPFIVGGTGNSNGVNGTINVTSATGGGTLTNWVYGGVYITNGDESSTGGITLTNMTDLQVSRSASRSGLIFLDAQDGTLTLPSGTLQSNGASSHGAGDILLLADTIAFGNDTTVSATQTGSSYGTDHGVSIAAENITFGGTTKGLEILADGDGNSQYEKGYVYILPKGSITITNSGDFQSMAWYKSYPNFYYDSGVVNLNGGTSAKLKVTANGDHTEVVVSGREMNFSGGTVDIQGRGATDHKVDIAYYGTQSPSAGLAFGGTGNVNIDANGESGDAGTVYIYVGDAQFDAPNVNIKAQGPTSGNGDGGRITFISTDLALNSSSKLSLNSDAASNGTGEALFSDITAYDPKAIEFFPGSVNLKLGYDNGEIALSARGGSQGGNAGAIALSGSGIQFYDNDAVKINAQDGDSNGGGLVAYTYFTGIDSSVTSAVIDASGHGSGIGGRVFAYHSISKFDVSKYIKVDGGDPLCQ